MRGSSAAKASAQATVSAGAPSDTMNSSKSGRSCASTERIANGSIAGGRTTGSRMVKAGAAVLVSAVNPGVIPQSFLLGGAGGRFDLSGALDDREAFMGGSHRRWPALQVGQERLQLQQQGHLAADRDRLRFGVARAGC